MKLLNLPNEYDITATVPALFRLLNYNIFNPDENIRQLIIDQSNMNTIINEKQLKPLTFRLVYAKSYEQSFAQLSNAYQNKSIPNDIPNILNYYAQLYDATQNIVGSTALRSEILKYESLFELRVVLALREQNYYTSNIYDCFYSEAPIDIIKNEIITQSHILYDDFINDRI
jgi:hypothetical protein